MNVARIAVLATAALTLLTVSAEAQSRHQSRHYRVIEAGSVAQGLGYGLHVMLRASMQRHGHRHSGGSYANLDAACRSAAAQGGPCGCWAQEYFFHSSARIYDGHNLFLAREWRHVYPHVAPAAGTAAVWPNGRHVAPVIAVNGDGTVTVHDSWGDHVVRAAGLTFVSPTGGSSYADQTHDGDFFSERRDLGQRYARYVRLQHYASAGWH